MTTRTGIRRRPHIKLTSNATIKYISSQTTISPLFLASFDRFGSFVRIHTPMAVEYRLRVLHDALRPSASSCHLPIVACGICYSTPHVRIASACLITSLLVPRTFYYCLDTHHGRESLSSPSPSSRSVCSNTSFLSHLDSYCCPKTRHNDTNDQDCTMCDIEGQHSFVVNGHGTRGTKSAWSVGGEAEAPMPPNGTNPNEGFRLLRSFLIFSLNVPYIGLHIMAPNGVNGSAYDDEDIDYSDIEAKCVGQTRSSHGSP